MKKILFIIGIIGIVSFTSPKTNYPSFVGKWRNTWDKESCYEFTEDGKIIEQFTGHYYTSEGKQDIPVTRHFFYKVETYKEGWLLKIFNAENNKFIHDKYIHFENDTMILTSFKTKKGIHAEIDEVGVLVKPDNKLGSKKRNINISKSIFYLPDNYIGLFHVLHNNSDRKKELEENNRIYRIPDDGVLSTAYEARPKDLVLKRELFYKGKGNIRLTTVSSSTLKQFKSTGVEPPYRLDSVYVLPLGFNQIEGKRRAKVTDNVFVKNIESFKIDTLKNLISKRVFPKE
ncbi:hypothetical protein [Carboxylicivirga marina]|uniref:hypothetical protein n=2 Tax=Carboxylicivirga TaxID=1628153 RepID=UPI003D33CCCF